MEFEMKMKIILRGNDREIMKLREREKGRDITAIFFFFRPENSMDLDKFIFLISSKGISIYAKRSKYHVFPQMLSFADANPWQKASFWSPFSMA